MMDIGSKTSKFEKTYNFEAKNFYVNFILKVYIIIFEKDWIVHMGLQPSRYLNGNNSEPTYEAMIAQAKNGSILKKS